MDLGSIFLILGLAVLVAAFVARPFLDSRRPDGQKSPAAPADAREHELSALLAERDQVLTTLQEMEFDHLLGKIPAEDYPSQTRAALVQHGAEVLRRLDALQPPARPIQDQPAAAAEDSLEAMITARRRSRQGKTGGFCAKCGSVIQPGDRFCSKCGAPAA